MIADELAALYSACALLVAWVGYHFVWKRTALDLFRQELYALRDGLFHDAADGHVRFDDPAYGMLRMGWLI